VSTRTRANVTTTLPALLPGAFPGFGHNAPVDLPPLDADMQRQVADLLTSHGFDAWSEALARVGNCANPIRLHGGSQTVDPATGEILATYSSGQEPLGVTHVRCGNRRASECPSCSRLYAGDMFQLIRAGVSGGKTVPASVAENPLVFATVTAPSFGTVHGQRADGRPCRPHSRGGSVCPHGRPRTCHAQHGEDDPALGQPLCPDCYDYASHLVWQWWAPDLWRRFTITVRRLVAKTLGVPASRLSEVATVQYAKVAEYQLRGVVHFHALVRLDGPKTTDGFALAPATLDPVLLARLVEQAVRTVRLTVPGVDQGDPSRVLAFGRQLDARPCAQIAAPTTPTLAWPPGRWPATWPSTPPSPPPTPAPATTPITSGSGPPPAGSPPAPATPAAPAALATVHMSCSASGSTCSASAVTSPPSRAATRSPSARSAAPAAAPRS
jgi:hypothetical protein